MYEFLASLTMTTITMWALLLLTATCTSFALLSWGILPGAVALAAGAAAWANFLADGYPFWPAFTHYVILHTIFMFAFVGLLRVGTFISNGRLRLVGTDLTGDDK